MIEDKLIMKSREESPHESSKYAMLQRNSRIVPGKSLPKLITTNNTPAASRANTLNNSRKAYSKATFNSGQGINQVESEMLFKQTPEERFAKRLFEDHSQNIFNH
jgi:hypothetical protein